MTPIKLTSSHAGCLFDSHSRGHYIVPTVIEYADDLGRPTDPFVKYALFRYSTDHHLNADEFPHEALIEESDKAIQWMNDNCAPEGYAFDWNDGDFGLYPIEDEDG